MPTGSLANKLPVGPSPSPIAFTSSVAVDRAFSDFLEMRRTEIWWLD